MTLTLIALFMLPIYFKVVLDPSGTYAVLQKIGKNDTMQYISAVIILTLALLIFATTGLKFSWSWDSLLAWIGVLFAVKGIAYLVPGYLERKLKYIKEKWMPFLGFIGLLFALFLVYVDTQLLI